MNSVGRHRRADDLSDVQAIEDGDACDEELADAEPVYPPRLPDQVRALRARLGLTQAQVRSPLRLHARHGATI